VREWHPSVLCTAAAAILTSRSAHAATNWLHLERGPGAETCDDESALASAIDRQLGRPAAEVARRARVSARARIEPQDSGGWRAELTVVDADGDAVAERTMTRSDASCAASMEALAVVAALLLEKEETREASDVPRATPKRADAPAQESAPPPETPVSPPAEEIRTVRFTLSGGAVVAAGLLPRGAIGAGGAMLVVGPSGLGGYLALSTWAQQQADVGADRAVGVGLTEVGLGACWASSGLGTSWAASACFGADLGRLGVTGIGFANAMSDTRWTVNLAGGAWLHQPIGESFELVLGGRMEVPLLRDSFEVVTATGETQTAFRLSPIAAVGDLGLGYAFP
jgi:hypothetical protein